MRTAKHTPGPWYPIGPTLGHTAEMDKRIMVLHHDHTRLIANCSEGYTMPNGETIPESERIANARLIAAAPNLLAALHHTLAALDDAMKTHPHWIYADAQNEARSAIAKAERRSP